MPTSKRMKMAIYERTFFPALKLEKGQDETTGKTLLA